MNDAMKSIRALVSDVSAWARRSTWSLARTTPEARQRRAQARLDRMTMESEPFRRMGKAEHERVLHELLQEEASTSGAAASVARYHLEPKQRELDHAYRELVARCRRDPSLSMPNALDNLDPGAMLTFHLLQETLRPLIARASAAELLQRYSRAMETRDAQSLIVATLVEERVDFGGLAASPDDLPIIRQLNDYIGEVQDLRVPFSIDEVRNIETAIESGHKAISMCELAQVKPINADHPANLAARQAFEAESGEFAAAVSGGQ